MGELASNLIQSNEILSNNETPSTKSVKIETPSSQFGPMLDNFTQTLEDQIDETLEKSLQCDVSDEVGNGVEAEPRLDSLKDELCCSEDFLESLIDDSGDRNPSFVNKDSYSPVSDPGLDYTKPFPVGAGLANLGNTCFLNAIMQCFTHTVPLVQGLMSLKHDPSSHGICEYCVLCSVREHIDHSLAYSGRVFSPSKLVDNLRYISSSFKRYQQEDAHEFLQCLLDELDNNWLKYEKIANISSSTNSLVKQVFGGRLVSQLRCSKCGHNSYTHEPLIDLSLGIEDVDNLESALRSFTKVESIGDTEKFTCKSCTEQVTGEKQLMLDQPPSVAALHLKRYGITVEKIDKKIEYPLELDLKPYVKESAYTDEELKYELYGVVVHVGFSSTSGHYFCYVRTAPDSWYRFDDSKVSRVTETTALSQEAYILFYARKGTPWFSTLFDEWKLCSEKKILNTSPRSVMDDTDLPSTSKSFGPCPYNFDTVEKSNAVKVISDHPSVAEVDAQVSVAANTTLSSSSRVCPKKDNAGIDAMDSAETNNGYNKLPMEQRSGEDATTLNDKGSSSLRVIHEANFASLIENIIDSEAKHDVDMYPVTPPRSPSPGIYSDEDPADAAYRIPVDHLKAEDKALTAKKAMEKAEHEIKRKEAIKYMSKSMPSGRRQLLMSAMMGGSNSDGLLNKKRKQGSSMQSKQSQKKTVKISPKRVTYPVSA